MLVTLLRLAFIEAKAVGTAAQALSLIQAETSQDSTTEISEFTQ